MIVKVLFLICFVIALFHVLYKWYTTELAGKTKFTLMNPFTLDEYKQADTLSKCNYVMSALIYALVIIAATLCISPLLLILLCLVVVGYALFFTISIIVFVILPYAYVADLFSPGVFEMVINDIIGICK